MTEVQVNIFSLAVQKEFGNPSLFSEDPKFYSRIFSYLAKPQAQKNYDEMQYGNGIDHFGKLLMLWQLQLGFGEEFYPTLHRAFREIPTSQLPTTEETKKQNFMVIASKTANRNLLSFFDMWGMRPSTQTRTEITSLNLPSLEKPIWEGTSEKPVVEIGGTTPPAPETSDIEVDLSIEKNKITIELDTHVQQSENRIIIMINDRYIGENYKGVSYYGKFNNTTNNKTIITSTERVNLSDGDVVKVYLTPGVPGNPLNLDRAQMLTSEKYTEAPSNTVSKPTDLQSLQVSHQSIRFDWKASTATQGIDKYLIFRNGTQIGTSQTPDFRDDKVSPNTTYRYQVQAVDSKGQKSEKSDTLTAISSQAPASGENQWVTGGRYTAGQTVEHLGKTYVVLQTHTNYGDPNWAPGIAPSLFRLVK